MSKERELLRRIQRYIGNQYLTAETLELSNDIDDFLAAEPKAEPVFIQPDHLQKARIAPFLCRVEPKQRDDFIPLYTRPEPARKPMTEEELRALFRATNTAEPLSEGWPGLERFARAIEQALKEKNS
jgi:hypothetical protein